MRRIESIIIIIMLHRVPNSTIFHLECKCGRQEIKIQPGCGRVARLNRALRPQRRVLLSWKQSRTLAMMFAKCDWAASGNGAGDRKAEQPFQFQLIKAPFRRQTLISGKGNHGEAKQNWANNSLMGGFPFHKCACRNVVVRSGFGTGLH